MGQILQPDKNEFIVLASAVMPFDKYKGIRLIDLPEHCLDYLRIQTK
ncbi:MAG: DUF3820 family protein [Pseudomonadota bacterium]